MKLELQAKFLQHLSKKKPDSGFTLVELLVVVIVIGILVAIALPSYLNEAATAKHTEARQNIAALTRAQLNWRGANSSFADSFDKLALGVVKGASKVDATTSSVYQYTLDTTDQNTALHGAEFKDPKLKSYSGGASISINNAGNPIWASIICEATGAGQVVSYPNASASSCPASYIELKVAGKGV
jgi:type IV pilus assembly protein PilA